MNDRRKTAIPVAQERRAVEEDRIEAKTPFGTIKASGNMVVLLVVIVCGFAGLGFMVRDSDMRQMSFSTDARAERNLQYKESKEIQTEGNYILAKCLSSKDECQKLQFDMPESLRRKIGR